MFNLQLANISLIVLLGYILNIGCSCIPFPEIVNHASYYVSTNGSDTNIGTLTQPWRTIQKAADTAMAGDTVLIRGGIYNETVLIHTNTGTAAAPITFTNYQGEPVTIKATGWTSVYINKSSWIILDGLKATGASYHGIAVSNASNVIIRNCESYNNNWAGIFIAGTVDTNIIGGNTQNIQVTNCSIHNNTHEGIYMKSGWATENVSGLLVDNNTIFNNGDEAVQNTYWEQSPNNPAPPSGTIIRSNKIYGNGCDWGVMDLMGDNLLVEDNFIHDNIGKAASSATTNNVGITFQHGSGLLVRNNIFSNNSTLWSSAAIFYFEQPGNVQVYNNTVYKTTNRGVRISNSNGQILIKNNIFSQVSGKLVVGADSNTTVDHNLFDKNDGTNGTNAIIGDPKFMNPSGNNFHLQDTSPAIDTGVTLRAQVNADFDNTSRPQGLGYDIGAFEVGGWKDFVPTINK